MVKRDIERKNRYKAKMHTRKNHMHVHISKELKNNLSIKSRALLINKGDNVRIMRGTHKNKNGKIAKVNYSKRVVYIEGITRKNAKGTERLISFQPSNLMLTELNMTKERKKEFGEPAEAPKI